MDDLRFALLIAGGVLVVGIYAFTRFRRRDGAAGGDMASHEDTSDAAVRGQRNKAGRSRKRRDEAAGGGASDSTARSSRRKAAGGRGRRDPVAGDETARGDGADAAARGSWLGDGKGHKRQTMFARLWRRDAAAGDGASEAVSRKPDRKGGEGRKRRHLKAGGDASEAPVRDSGRRRSGPGGHERHGAFDLHSTADYDMEGLGGVFAPRRETSDAELSVDMSVLSGLRATYESTLDSLSRPMDPRAADAGMANADVTDPGANGAGTVDVDAADVATVDPGTIDAGTMDTGTTDVSTADVEPGGASEQPILDLSRPIVHLLLLARYGRLSGRAILGALEAEGFRPGPLRIYYWRSDSNPSTAFGIANLAEPGALDPESLPDMEVRGLVTFMCVPDQAAEARETLDAMMTVSRNLSRRLDAALCDESRSTLAAQSENHLREKVVEIARRSRLKG